MTTRGRTLRITAALVLSALALTGFTTGRGHGGGGRHSSGSGGGGGCSSSNQDHDSSSSSSSGSSGSTTSGSSYDDDDHDDSYGSGGSGGDGSSSTGGGTYNRRPTHHSTSSSSSSSPGGEQLEDAKAELVSCATKKAPYATVRVTNDNRKKGRFWASVTFVDADGVTIIEESAKVKVSGKGKATARVNIGGEGLVDSVDHCEVDPQAIPVSG
ncbi:hypothetical protein ACFVXC_22175 [Streptomyces sp. NPDC058257]|uniref:hypothetical protein n=1 Tax=Streptomyces sp. NPDC058257 TaxID=3346409 RepID=UPI0036E30715